VVEKSLRRLIAHQSKKWRVNRHLSYRTKELSCGPTEHSKRGCPRGRLLDHVTQLLATPST
jgi:hypothetical protein